MFQEFQCAVAVAAKREEQATDLAGDPPLRIVVPL